MAPTKLVIISTRFAYRDYSSLASVMSCLFYASCSSLVCFFIMEKSDYFPAVIFEALNYMSFTFAEAFILSDSI